MIFFALVVWSAGRLEAVDVERRRIEARFQGLLEAAPDAIVVVDQDGRIEMINAQAEQLFGYPREELAGRPIEVLIPERLRGAHERHRAGFLATPTDRAMGSGLCLDGRRKDASTFPAEVSLSPVETGEGTLVMAAVRDVTERARTQAELAARARPPALWTSSSPSSSRRSRTAVRSSCGRGSDGGQDSSVRRRSRPGPTPRPASRCDHGSRSSSQTSRPRCASAVPRCCTTTGW